jgi:K+-sensing histidine kinase KdpD
MHDETDGGSLVVASLGAIAVIVAAALLVPARDWLGNTNVALVLVGIVVAAAALAGRVAGVTTALAAAVSYNFFHTEPYRTLRIDDREDIITVALIVIVGVAVGEVALLARHERARSRSRARGARDIEEAVGLLASDAPVDDVWAAVRDALAAELGVTGAEFRPGPPAEDAPTIDRAGHLHPMPRSYVRSGFALPTGTCIPVVAAGRTLGCIVLTPTAQVGVSPEQRRVAVALADVLGLALARSPSIRTLR